MSAYFDSNLEIIKKLMTKPTSPFYFEDNPLLAISTPGNLVQFLEKRTRTKDYNVPVTYGWDESIGAEMLFDIYFTSRLEFVFDKNFGSDLSFGLKYINLYNNSTSIKEKLLSIIIFEGIFSLVLPAVQDNVSNLHLAFVNQHQSENYLQETDINCEKISFLIQALHLGPAIKSNPLLTLMMMRQTFLLAK